MRITNQMMTNNMMSNINKNKYNLNKYDEQYSTGKKIQRPSDDPIIAVRALKLRTNLVQLNQYLDKNIPDALSWMDVTESALKNVNQILTDMNTYCVDGSNDDLTVDNRNSIIQNLMELQKHIYQEGDANYAGRYVFTGYKTDKSLIFNSTDKLSDYQYNITEDFKVQDIDTIKKVTGSYAVPTDTSLINSTMYGNAPTTVDTYRIRLAYDTLDEAAGKNFNLTYSFPDGAGGTTTRSITPTSTAPDYTMAAAKKSTDPGAYQVGDDQIAFLADTGEVIIGKNIYNEMRKSDGVAINYDKVKFKEGDLRPEHYFNCSKYELDNTGARIEEKDGLGNVIGYKKDVTYVKEDQDILYEINFNQKIAINVQGKDCIKHDIGRDIEEIFAAADDVKRTESKIAEVKKLRADGNNSTTTNEALDALLGQLETEQVLKNSALQKVFAGAITNTKEQQDTLNQAVADLGSRYNRVELTESRLDTQKVDFTDLLSSNEDADLAETYINLSMAEMVYNASLSAASKAVSNTLLDFI